MWKIKVYELQYFHQRRNIEKKSLIEDAAVLSGLDDDEDKDEDEDNNEYVRDDFVVEDGAEEEEDEASMPRRQPRNHP